MHCKEALISIASAIGKPLRIDQATASLARPSVARVLVEYDVTQPPLQRIRISVGDSGFWHSVNFEKIPMYCASCKHLGHSIETCYVANPGLRPQRPNRNWQTRIDNKKSEVLPSDTPQPLDTPRPEPSITKQIIDDWRDIALPKELSKGPRARTLGANSLVTGFGSEFEALGSINNAFPRSGVGSACSATDSLLQKNAAGVRSSEWWFDEDGLFNLDDEGRAEKQQCAVGTSNIVRNFSFMPENEVIVAQHRHCLETMFQCIEDHVTEYEELVTNALETIVNLAPLLDL
ncbi:armadillo repeat-containing protein LFR-like [Citrus sinensis]|uniref:armadillo repeat-containing protein LFR-like n=1 Tax=Citrus sinensis TaxID=2711 RepID=UPI002278CC9D|nr:armadillo repeat-containing protein LFR-like [Citrus sinensis]